MDTTTPTSTPPVVNAIANAGQIITAIIPELGPYGAAIGLGIAVLEKVAPPVYREIVTLIEQIRNGNTLTNEDLAKLAGLVAQLKNPDAYFATPPATPVA